MKIIIVGPAHPYRGGIADTNEAFCRALNRQGHHASILTFTLQYPGFLFPGKTQYSSEPAPASLSIKEKINSINPFNWLSTARFITKQKPDAVIIRYWTPFLAPCLGSIARLISKKTTVIAFCDNIIPHERKFYDGLLTRYFVNACHAFITLSQTVHEELRAFTQKKAIAIPHPINDQLEAKVEKPVARKKLSLDIDGKYILFFGLVRRYKGLDLLMEAMSDERLKERNVKLLVAGEFYEDPDFYTAMIRNLSLETRVIIRNEFIPASEMKYYFSAGDLVAQTYRTASQSGISQLAYHFDCPLLVTNVGGLAEMVPPGKVGYVVNLTPQAIADAVCDFYDHHRAPDFIHNLQQEKLKYSWDQFALQTAQLIQSL